MNDDNSSFEEYIDIYSFLEWAKSKNRGSTIQATYEICQNLKASNETVNVYEYFSGITKRLVKQEKSLYQYILEINKNAGYQNNSFDDDIPF